MTVKPRALLIPVAVFVASAAAVGVAQTSSDDHRGGPANAPAGPQTLVAKARDGSRDRDHGLITYRNRAGERCIAQGQLRDGQIGADVGGDFKRMPLEEGGGICGPSPQPLTYAVARVTDDPATAADEARTEIFGLAAPDVRALRFESSSFDVDITLQDENAYVVVVDDEFHGLSRFVVTRGDGSVERVALPDLEPMDELSDLAERSASTGHEHHP